MIQGIRVKWKSPNGTYVLAVRNTDPDPISVDLQVTDITPSLVNSGFDLIRSGSLSSGEVDQYTLEAKAGTLILVDSLAEDGVRLEILDPSGRSVRRLTLSTEVDPIWLSQTGPYTLRLDQTGDYRFWILDLFTAPALNPGSTLTLDPLETEVYQFTGSVGEFLSYRPDASVPEGITVGIYSPSGQVIQSDSLSANLGLQLREPGDYLLIFSNTQTDPASFSFQFGSPTEVALDTEITDVSDAVGTLFYTLLAGADQRVYLDAAVADPLRLSWRLLSPDGESVGGISTFSPFEVVIPTDGDYVVEIEQESVQPQFSFELITSPEEITPLILDQTVSGELLELGEQELYTFTGTSGQRLYFDGLSASNGITATLQSPSGVQILSLSPSANSRPFTLDETGIYQLRVDGTGANLGEYSFRILDLADAQVLGLDEEQITMVQQESQFYRVILSEELPIYFQFDGIVSTLRWSLYNVSNGVVTEPGSFFSGSDDERLLPAGEYLIEIRGRSSSPITVGIELITPQITTASSAIGEVISGSLAEPGQQDIYTFTGSAGQQVFVDQLTGASGIDATLLSPSGETIYGRGVSANDADPFYLKEMGIYQLVVDGDARAIGDYSLRILDLATVAFSLPFDTLIQGSLNPISQSQFYRFEGQADQRLYFDLRDIWTFGAAGTNWILYGPGEQTLALPDPRDPDIEIRLPAEGSYLLGIRGGTNNAATEDYEFQVVTIPETQSRPLQLGEEITGQITEAGEQAIYTFEGFTGQRLVFDALEGSEQIQAQLLSESGVILFTTAFEDVLPVVLRETGPYQLILDGLVDATGAYQFRLLNEAETPLLSFTEPTSGDLDPGAEIDLYQFEGEADQRIYLDLERSEPGVTWRLYGPDSRPLSTSTGSDIEQILPVAGTYLLLVQGSSSTPVAYSIEALLPTTTFTPLEFNTPLDINLDSQGQQQILTFTGTLGQRLFFDSLTGLNGIQVELFSPSQRSVFSDSSQDDIGPQTLEETGPYQLRVDGSGDQTGSVSFQVLDLSAALPLEIGTPITGEITTPRAVQLYSLSGSTGQQLSFDLEAPTWQEGNWILYGPDDQVLASPAVNSPDFTATLTVDGTYTLAILNSSPDPLSYTFTVTDLTPTPVTPAGLNSPQQITLTSGSPSTYPFTAAAGTQILFDGQGPLSAGITLLNPDGSQLFSRTLSTGDQGPLVLQQSGEYTLQLSGDGDYGFQVLAFPQSLLDPALNYLELGGVVSGSLATGEARLYTFAGEPGQKLYLNGIEGSMDVTLYSDSGASVLEASNLRTGDRGPLTLTREQNYHLVLQGQGDFQFQLIDLTVVGEIQPNVSVEGTLVDGRRTQIYRLSVEAGERFYFDSLMGTSITRWVLFDPSNGQVFSTRLDLDAEVEISTSGEHYLMIQGGGSTAPLSYRFRAFQIPPDPLLVLVPGAGESGAALQESSDLIPVQLEVRDGRGGSGIQPYQIRLLPDPENSSPVIVSQPQTRAQLREGLYRYPVQSVDPDEDRLLYRLLESPLGAVIDSDTGELLWSLQGTMAGETVSFTVEVSDLRGGFDQQSFTVEVFDQLGTIRGAVFDDLNGNGVLDTTLLQGDDPSIIFAVDVSGSTVAPFVGRGETAEIETVLDGERAAILAFREFLVGQGQGDSVRIGVIPHRDRATLQDMDPATPGVQPFTTAGADADNNGVSDLEQILNSYQSQGGNDFVTTLDSIRELVGVLPGDPNVVFLSDGYDTSFARDPNAGSEVLVELEAAGVNLKAFGVGKYATLSTLERLDPEVLQILEVDELIGIFAGIDPRFALEPFLENILVYLDLDEDGQVDEDEPSRVTRQGETPYYYTFADLSPGTYAVQQFQIRADVLGAMIDPQSGPDVNTLNNRLLVSPSLTPLASVYLLA